MLSKGVYFLVTCLIVAIVGCDSGNSTGTLTGATERSFLVRDIDGEDLVELDVSTVVFSIRFVEGLSDEEKDTVLASEPSARSLADQVGAGDHDVDRDIHAIALHPGLTASDTLALVHRLSRRNDVIFANPGLQLTLEYFGVTEEEADENLRERLESLHFIFTDEFYAEFSLETPEEDVDALNASMAVEVVRISVSELRGTVLYTLRVTEETGFDAFDAVDAYFEDPLALDSSPILHELASAVGTLPSIRLLTPVEGDSSSSGSFVIRWRDDDAMHDRSNHEIRLFLDTDDEGRNGMLIADGISEDDETDEFVWDTSEIPPGTYYIFAEMYNRVWPPVYSYSPGPIVIE